MTRKREAREALGDLASWIGYLREMGVRDLRSRTPGRGAAAPGATASGAPMLRQGAPDAQGRAPAPEGRAGENRAVSAAARQLAFGDEPIPRPSPRESEQRLAEVRDDLGECTRCRLCEGRTNIVFGVGSPRARLMFIGEGPGADEDAQGEPFVGRAGKKLDEMIRAMGLRRAEVYIANVVKCRPPENRAPERDEIATCSPFLFAQIEAIRPAVIVTLGAPATRTLLGTKQGITKVRGQWHSFRGIPVMPTFHPAYLLRAYTTENRGKVWQDLQAALARMTDAK